MAVGEDVEGEQMEVLHVIKLNTHATPPGAAVHPCVPSPTHHLLHLLKLSEDVLLALKLPQEGTSTDEGL